MVFRITRAFAIFASVYLSALVFTISDGEAGPPQDFVEEAKKLYALEETYFQKRMANEWQAIYDLQHPAYRQKISLEEFLFFDGRAMIDYREIAEQHVSGAYLLPSKESIKQNPGKKDMLGFPAPRKYQFVANPLVTIERQSINKISIGKNKKYAKVAYTLFGEEMLNPGLVRGIFKFHVEIPVTDYWEKAEGRWVITVLKKPVSISGVTQHNFLPNNSDGWDAVEFVDIDAAALAVSSKK